MTITVAPARNEYTANAGQTIFNYTFKIFDSTDLNVYITPSGQDANDSTDLTTAYTVTGLGDEDGGTITLAVGATLNDLVTIVSNVPSSRVVDYQNNGDFRPDTVNADFDRVVSIVKKIEDTANRSVLLQQSQQDPKPLTLPKPEFGKLLFWNQQETGLENGGIPTTVQPELLSSTVAGMISSNNLKPGDFVKTLGFHTEQDGGQGDYLIVSPQSFNGFDKIELANGNVAILQVKNGRVSTAQLGSNKSASDYLILDYALNNTPWSHIDIINYSPIGGSAHIERSNCIVDGNNQLIDFTGVSNPMIVTGEDSLGAPLALSNINIDFRNMLCVGDKTLGSTVVKYRKTSTCTHHNWIISALDYGFTGDGSAGAGYESLACKFFDMDLRNCNVGFYDPEGSFQASTFYGGRIEQNAKEGVITFTTNLCFNGTIIEGNDVDLAGHAQVLTGGGGDLQFIDAYMELKAASPEQAFIRVDTLSTKRVSVIGGRYYGQNQLPGTAILVAGGNWTLGSCTVIGAQLNEIIQVCSRGGTVGNWHGSFDYWANVQLNEPDLNGANFSLNERIKGFKAKEITAIERVYAENVQVQQVGSAGFSREFHRFIGRISVGGAGDWHQVIDLDDVGAAGSTAIRFDLYFFERGGDFQFYTTIMLNGTSTLKTKEDVSGNWTASLYRINAGFLEVDNLPASNRDWTCRVVATKGNLT